MPAAEAFATLLAAATAAALAVDQLPLVTAVLVQHDVGPHHAQTKSLAVEKWVNHNTLANSTFGHKKI